MWGANHDSGQDAVKVWGGLGDNHAEQDAVKVWGGPILMQGRMPSRWGGGQSELAPPPPCY